MGNSKGGGGRGGGVARGVLGCSGSSGSSWTVDKGRLRALPVLGLPGTFELDLSSALLKDS